MIQNHLNNSTIWKLSFCHILLLTISNFLVQYPFEFFGYHTTWGAFTYPAIFILTDLTTRLFAANIARKIVFLSMVPGLLISYIISSSFESTGSWNDMLVVHIIPLRISIASFVAYAVGQLLDITVFQQYRNSTNWWVAPAFSTITGNIVDTLLFFSIAFYHCSNPFLSQHWPEIATVDVFFKIVISLLAFVPIYGFVLRLFFINSLQNNVHKAAS